MLHEKRLEITIDGNGNYGIHCNKLALFSEKIHYVYCL